MKTGSMIYTIRAGSAGRRRDRDSFAGVEELSAGCRLPVRAQGLEGGFRVVGYLPVP